MLKTPLPKSLKLFTRKGLEDLLERAVNRRLTIVSGAPGRGKSTLILSLLHSLNVVYFWYSAGKSQDSTIEFSKQLLKFLNSAPEQDKPDKQLRNQAADQLLQDILNSVASVYGAEDIYIVIDNFGENERRTEFEDFIQDLINSSPLNIHYILISQNNLAFGEVSNNLIYSRIIDEQLIFSADDTAEYFKEGYVIYLNKAQASTIHTLTEGWAAAMNAIAENMLVNAGLLDSLHKNSVEDVIKLPQLKDFLSRIYATIKSQPKSVLLATCIDHEFEPELAVLLAGGKEALLELDHLVSNNLLIKQGAEQSNTYRYHKLWQSFLYKKARETLGLKRVTELHDIAGLYYFSKSRWKEAFYHFIQAGNFEQICNTMKHAGPEILDSNLTGKLFSQVKAFSPEKITENPWAQYGYAYSLRFKDAERCYYYLSSALKGFRDIRDDKGILQTLLIMLETLMFYTGGPDKLGE